MMDEKRFRCVNNDNKEYDFLIYDRDVELVSTEVVDLLNSLVEENKLMSDEEMMSKKINELEKEDKRLNDVINNLHHELRQYDRKVKKQHMIINIQWDMIACLMELKGVIEDE